MLKITESHVTKCILVTIIGIFIGFILMRRNRNVPEFKIYQSISIESGGYIDTSISVIVMTKEYETEKLFTEIKDFHNNMNGEPDRLAIYLYSSKRQLRGHNCIDCRIYYKEGR